MSLKVLIFFTDRALVFHGDAEACPSRDPDPEMVLESLGCSEVHSSCWPDVELLGASPEVSLLWYWELPSRLNLTSLSEGPLADVAA
jgi:hypothetical protein